MGNGDNLEEMGSWEDEPLFFMAVSATSLTSLT
jgi:hypothetical protein